MNVEELMTRDVKTSSLADTLHAAARIMWEHDCGCVPVVDEESRVLAMLTDRDVCMAAYFQDRPLSTLHVSDAMSNQMYTCSPGDSVQDAERLMRERQIRRVPIVDETNRLVGILSLNDVARAAARPREARKKQAVKPSEVGETLATICEPRSPEPAAMAP
ncbi:MAG: CBS domain-containing protein [Candidatus Binatia bacterium]